MRRVPLEVIVKYQHEGIKSMNFSANIGERGIFIESMDPLPVDSKIDIEITFPHNNKTICLKGRVVWRRYGKNKQGKAGMGIEFLKDDKNSYEQLSNVIKYYNKFLS